MCLNVQPRLCKIIPQKDGVGVLTFSHIKEGSLNSLFQKKKKNVLLKEGPLAQTNISKVSMRCLGRPFAKAARGKFK